MRLIDADMLLKEIENIYSQAWAGRDFADIVQQQPTINAKPVKHGRWISISEKMPPELQDVIVSDGNFTATGYFMNLMEMWHIYGNSIPQHKEAYTYWQPLPEPPERNDNT